MLLLSIDVGITNMAFCVLDTSSQLIVDWKTIDLQANEKPVCMVCSKPAKLINTEQQQHFCVKHSKQQPQSSLTDLKKPRQAKTVSLIEIGKSLKTEFDKINGVFHHIIIENQISPIATRMKTIQGMIAQYFIMRQENAKIDFVSSSNKLKGAKKMTYKERKKAGIERCIKFLEETSPQPLTDIFLNSKKKDDLADSLLQGLFWLQNRIKN